MCHVCSRPLLHICTRKCVWLVRTAVLDKHSSTWAAKGGNIAQYALNECSFIQSVSEHKHHAAHNHCVPRVPGRCKSHCQLLQFWLIRGEAIELQIYIPQVITTIFQRETMFEGQLNSIMRKEYPHLLGRHFESIIRDFYPETENHWGLSENFFSACSLGNDRRDSQETTYSNSNLSS